MYIGWEAQTTTTTPSSSWRRYLTRGFHSVASTVSSSGVTLHYTYMYRQSAKRTQGQEDRIGSTSAGKLPNKRTDFLANQMWLWPKQGHTGQPGIDPASPYNWFCYPRFSSTPANVITAWHISPAKWVDFYYILLLLVNTKHSREVPQRLLEGPSIWFLHHNH